MKRWHVAVGAVGVVGLSVGSVAAWRMHEAGEARQEAQGFEERYGVGFAPYVDDVEARASGVNYADLDVRDLPEIRPEVRRRVLDSVVKVVNYAGNVRGSGLLLQLGDVRVATAAHVLLPGQVNQLEITTNRGHSLAVANAEAAYENGTRGTDEDLGVVTLQDAASLDLEALGARPIPVRDLERQPLRLGEMLGVVGFPVPHDVGNPAIFRVAYAGRSIPPRLFSGPGLAYVATDLDPRVEQDIPGVGFSGGFAFDERGEAVGVVSSGQEDVGLSPCQRSEIIFLDARPEGDILDLRIVGSEEACDPDIGPNGQPPAQIRLLDQDALAFLARNPD